MSSNYYSVFHKDWMPHYLYDLAEWVNGLAFRKINFEENGEIPIIKINELKNGFNTQTGYTNQSFDKKYGGVLNVRLPF